MPISNRYYTCKGVIRNDPEFGPITVPRVAEPPYNAGFAGVWNADQSIYILNVASDSHGQMQNDPDIDPMPLVGLHDKMSAIGQGAFNAMQIALTARGIAATVSQNSSLLDLFNEICHELDPTTNRPDFDFMQLDVN